MQRSSETIGAIAAARKRGKTSGGMILRFSGGRESDSFLEWRRPGILTVCRTPS
jgi:hypothetical protein